MNPGASVPTPAPGPAADLPADTHLRLDAIPGSDAAVQRERGSDTNKDSVTTNNISDCFLRLATLPTFTLDRLSRYEHLLWRQTRQLVFTLESLERRKKQPKRSRFSFSSIVWLQNELTSYVSVRSPIPNSDLDRMVRSIRILIHIAKTIFCSAFKIKHFEIRIVHVSTGFSSVRKGSRYFRGQPICVLGRKSSYSARSE